MKTKLNQIEVSKNKMISARILALRDAGMDIRQAFDAVIGEGAYRKLAGEIWEHFNAGK